MLKMQKIMIAEDHVLLRQGLSSMISAEPDMEIVGEVDNGHDAIRLASSLMPALILMDLSMPKMNGIEATMEMKKRFPSIKILILTVHLANEYIREALKAGADGYILKHATQSELIQAIRNVLNGKTYISPDIGQHVVYGYLEGVETSNIVSAWESVTLRERQILKLIAEGHTSKYIANFLFISQKTVEKHRSNLMRKLDLHNAATLTAFAIEKGMIGRDSNSEEFDLGDNFLPISGKK